MTETSDDKKHNDKPRHSRHAQVLPRHAPLFTAVAFILLLWLGFALWVQQLQNEHRRTQESQLVSQRYAVAERVDGIFRIVEMFLATASQWMESHPDSDPRTDSEFVGMVQHFQRINSRSMLVRLAAADGTLHLVPAEARARATGRWAVAVATRTAKPTQGIAVIFVELELSIFDETFRKARVGEDRSVTLLRSDGIVLARSATNPGQLGASLANSALFSQGLPKGRDGILLTDARYTDNVPKLLAFVSLDRYPLIVTVGRSVLGATQETEGIVMSVALILMVLSGFAVEAARHVAARHRAERILGDALQESERFRFALDRVPAYVYLKDRALRYTYANQPTLELFGTSPEKLLGSRDAQFFPEEAVSQIQEVDHRVLRGESTRVEITVPGEGGRRVYFEVKTPVFADETKTEIVGLCGISTDITQIKDYQQKLEQMAHFDPLTGLANRALLADRMRQALAHALRRQTMVSVAYIDLDGFKAINDAHGHETGDRLLVALAARMGAALRDGDTLSRLGGDEFVAMLIDLQSREDGLPIIERLLAAASEPVTFEGACLSVSASIGVTFFPLAQLADADALLRQADQAMYQAKKQGKNRYCIFEDDS